MRRVLVTLMLTGFAGLSVSAEPRQFTDEDLRRLVAELGASEFEKRQKATQSLQTAGVEAIPLLAPLMGNKNPEIQRRALQVLLSMSASEESGTAEAAQETLRKFQATASERVARRIEQELSRLGDHAKTRVAELRRQRASAGKMSPAEAVEIWKELGGSIEREQAGTWQASFGGEEWTGQEDDLVYLRLVKNLRQLSVAFERVSDEVLVHLRDFPTVEELYLSKGVTDEGLVHLRPLKRLKSLEFTNAFELTGSGLRHLAGLKELTSINLYTTGVQGEYLRYLSDLPNLRSLRTSQTTMTDEGMPHIAKITSLEQLTMSNTTITDVALPYLDSLVNLKGLDISENPCLTDQAIKQLQKHPDLEYVRVGNNNVSDECLPSLEGFAHLRILSIDRTFISLDGLARLQKVYPNARITSRSCANRPGDAHWQALQELSPIGCRIHSFLSTRNGKQTLRNSVSLHHGWVGVGQDLVHLKHLEGIDTLMIRTTIDDAAVESLAQIPQVKAVYVRSPEVKNHQLRFLRGIGGLERLSLEGPFTDEAIPELMEMELPWLMLRDTHVSDEGIAKLKRRFPAVRVFNSGN